MTRKEERIIGSLEDWEQHQKKPATSVTAISESVRFVAGGSQHHAIILNGKEHFGTDQKSVHNALLLTELDDETKDFITFNIFTSEVYFITCPPWESPKNFTPHPVRDYDLLNYRAWMETRGLKITTKDCDDILFSLAQRNQINPPKEWMESLKWGGVARLDNWLINACDAQDGEEYLRLVGSKWLIAAVKRVYDPGCKFDTAMILEGKQGWEKSKAFEILATINNVKYFLDEAIRISDKDGLMKLQGKLIFEMSELATLQRGGETEEMKAFMSRRTDAYREPYKRKILERPRMFVIGGTINPTGGYLTDPTGARRYWPVECGDRLDIEWLELNKVQLWAEAVHRCKAAERIWMDQEEQKIADPEQRKRFKQAIMNDTIIDTIKKVEAKAIAYRTYYFSTEEVMNEIVGVDKPEKKTFAFNQQVKETLVFYGYVSCRPRQFINGEEFRGEQWVHQKYKRKNRKSVAGEVEKPEFGAGE